MYIIHLKYNEYILVNTWSHNLILLYIKCIIRNNIIDLK